MAVRSQEPLETSSLGEEVSRLLKLAWPVVLGQCGLTGLNLVDTVFAGKAGEHALAAVSLGNVTSLSAMMLGFGLLSGFDPFFSQAHGANNRAAGARALYRALFFSVVLAVPLILLHANIAPLMVLLNQPTQTIPLAAGYCGALAVGVLPVLLFSAIAQFLQGLGEMRAPMIAILCANVINVIFDAVLILGWEEMGIPAMGALGCGIATAVVQWGMLFFLLLIARKKLAAYPFPRTGQRVFDPRKLGAMLRVGAPVALQRALEAWAFSSLGVMMGMLGERELAAQSVAINIVSFTFMIPFGIGAAAATRVGNLVGAARAWHTTAWIAVAFSVAWMTMMAVIFTATGDNIASIFIEDAAVVATVGLVMPVAAAFQIFDGVQASAFGVLRGAGDTRWPAMINLLGYWIIGIPLGYWFGVHLYQDPRYVWGGVAVALAFISALVVARMVWVMKRGATIVQNEE